MKNPEEYIELLETGRYGKFYIIIGNHARGQTINIYIVDEKMFGLRHIPLLKRIEDNAVEVYGVIKGQTEWDAEYGWIHRGEWEKDIDLLFEKIRIKAESKRKEVEKEEKGEKKRGDERKRKILENY